MLAQVTPVTPEIAHVPVPLGVRPLVGPETVAVKVNVDPKVVVGVLVVTTTVGVNLAIVMLDGVIDPEPERGLKFESPGYAIVPV